MENPFTYCLNKKPNKKYYCTRQKLSYHQYISKQKRINVTVFVYISTMCNVKRNKKH